MHIYIVVDMHNFKKKKKRHNAGEMQQPNWNLAQCKIYGVDLSPIVVIYISTLLLLAWEIEDGIGFVEILLSYQIIQKLNN